jgi:hypothetical protein
MNNHSDETDGRAGHAGRRARSDAPDLVTAEEVPRERRAFHARLLAWLRALWSARSRWQRYRVTPRANPASFRRDLLRSIRGELRRSSLNPPRISRGTTL